ncbi:beta-parvin [Myotis lucifugus]|uniref:beta-parvin n=1 Tax=Myotis lucifugus TaxID=59463 RepID=UPI000CCC0627|nr:beta-parvin [Myotis lucifugus]
MSPALADLHPEDTLLEENEERTMIDPTSKEDPKFKELVKKGSCVEAPRWADAGAVSAVGGAGRRLAPHGPDRALRGSGSHEQPCPFPGGSWPQPLSLSRGELVSAAVPLPPQSLITFVNKHLNKLNLEVTELETQFADGVYLVLLMGLLEDYFVPLHNFYLTPDSFDQKVHNVSFAFELMLDGGLQKPKARPEDVVSLDLKSTLRVLYNLFNKYKNAE